MPTNYAYVEVNLFKYCVIRLLCFKKVCKDTGLQITQFTGMTLKWSVQGPLSSNIILYGKYQAIEFI